MKILKFEGDNCASCKQLATVMEGNGWKADEVISTDKHPEKAFEYALMGQPVLLLLDEDGKEVTRMTGFNPARIGEVESLFNQR